MRSLIVAAAIALSAPLALGTAADAATTKIIIKQDDHRSHRMVDRRGPHRVVEKRHVVRTHSRDCFTRKVVTKVRGERIVKMTKVCR